MDWTLFYQSGAIVTAAIASIAILRFEDLTERERCELGVIFLCGLLVWPALLFGVIKLIEQQTKLNQ